jgi:hypothetical protein
MVARRHLAPAAGEQAPEDVTVAVIGVVRGVSVQVSVDPYVAVAIVSPIFEGARLVQFLQQKQIGVERVDGVFAVAISHRRGTGSVTISWQLNWVVAPRLSCWEAILPCES